MASDEELIEEVQELIRTGIPEEEIEALLHDKVSGQVSWQSDSSGLNVAVRSLCQSIGLLFDVANEADEEFQQHLAGTFSVHLTQEELTVLAQVFATAAALREDVLNDAD